MKSSESLSLGLDYYVLYTDKAKIDSEFGMKLRERINEAAKNKKQAELKV